MRTFKLDRIKFNWKGTWDAGIDYIKDDIVYYDGKAFVCKKEHTSSNNFYTDKDALGNVTFDITVDASTIDPNIDAFFVNGQEKASLIMLQDRIHIFDQSDSSNVGHPLNLSILRDGKWQGGLPYNVGVVYLLDNLPVTVDQYIVNFDSATTRQIQVELPFSAPQNLYYYSTSNENLGSEISSGLQSYWELMFDGYQWKGDWQPNSFYSEDNIVKFKGVLYQCVEQHESNSDAAKGIEDDLENWKVYVRLTNWTGNWNIETYYDIGDVVLYGGITYRCIVQHLSADTFDQGLTVNLSNWEILSRSDNWDLDWQPENKYKKDDIVRYGGIVYRCTTGHVSANLVLGLEQDSANWEIVISGIEYKGTWQESTRYKKNDIIKYGATLYKCNLGHTSTASDDALENNSANWDIFIPGFEFDNAWDSQTYYSKGDVVLYGGYTYAALQFNLDSVPSVNGKLQNTGDWELVTTAYTFKQDWDSEEEYRTGEVVRDNGYLYVALSDSTDVQPDSDPQSWKVLNTGDEYQADWTNDAAVEYKLGDLIVYKGTLYRCIQRHFSGQSSQPDLDVADQGEFWQIVVKGSETNVLNSRGDIKYYDSEATDLELGTGGNALKVSQNRPVWETFNESLNVYYVSTEGFDDPNFGTTRTSPFRTVKFACEYILADQSSRAPATINIATGEYQEVLPISVPADVALVGDELRSTRIVPAEGYEQSDMFYVRNGSGIRQMTLSGLKGELGPLNSFLTRRPTAGAFVSLDPGTGPDDTSVHITSKSCYVQNVTTFGEGCIGMKVDGALHNAGNRSIVANDFTQILSDGIGYWADNVGRSELVSVFTYYCHIGYLCTNGGILRATNGNNSYGEFGTVAEGFDQTEDPVVATVNNRSKDAQVGQIITEGVDEQPIIALGYSNAGRSYSNATIEFSGSGTGAVAAYEEFRNSAIDKIRLLDPGDSTIPGGTGYTFISNNAISGNNERIFLSLADQNTAEDYVGQRIVLQSGRGVGQYAKIASFDATTKEVVVSRESDGKLGWDHWQPGYPIETVLDDTTQYTIEPSIEVESPILESEFISGPGSADWKFIVYGDKYVAVTSTSSGTNQAAYSDTGESWNTSNLDNDPISGLVYTGSKYLASKSQSNDGNSVNEVLQSADGVSWDTITLPISGFWTAISSDADGNVILVSSDSQNVLYSADNGDTWSITNTSGGGQNWVQAAHGKNKFVLIGENDQGQPGDIAISEDNGGTWTVTGSVLSEYEWSDLIYGQNKFVALGSYPDSSGSINVYAATSIDGVNWYEQETDLVGFEKISYGAGVFLATAAGNVIAKSEDGIVWRTFDDDSSDFLLTETEVWTNSVYNDGKWVVISQSSNWNTVTTGCRAKVRAIVESAQISDLLIYDPGSNYTEAPQITIFDNGNDREAVFETELQNGVLPQPEIVQGGDGFNSATAIVSGNGFADIFQVGDELIIENLSSEVGPGANLDIIGIDDERYSVSRLTLTNETAPFSAVLQIRPSLGFAESPDHNTEIQLRTRYSQARLTGHDFLDIGTGNQQSTSYPELYLVGTSVENDVKPFNETVANGGGRVFYTSTDQDGNYRVGELFAVEQSTGIVTISASQFDLQGLDELQLGGIQIGGTAVVIREFSTDPNFTANSNNVVPTQRAINTFISGRISGGGANAQTSTLVAGQVRIRNQEIDTTGNVDINFNTKAQLAGGVDGHYLCQIMFNAAGSFVSDNDK